MKVRLSDVVREHVSPDEVGKFLFCNDEELQSEWPIVWQKIQSEAQRRVCEVSQMVTSAKVSASSLGIFDGLVVKHGVPRTSDEVAAMNIALAEVPRSPTPVVRDKATKKVANKATKKRAK